MKIKLKNGVIKEIDKNVVENYMQKYNISQNEAIKMYLDSQNIVTDEEEVKKQKEDDAVNNYKIDHGDIEDKKPRKKREAKISEQKQQVFEMLVNTFDNAKNTVENFDYHIEIENKLIIINYNGKNFKLDLIESRK